MTREPSQDRTLRDLLRVLRRHSVLIGACVFIAAAAAIAFSILKTPVYEASAQVQFNDLSQDLNALGTPVVPPSDVAKGAAADAEIVTSNAVIDGVARRIDADMTDAEIRDSVDTAVDPNTNLVTIQTHSDDAAVAADLANAFAAETKAAATQSIRKRLDNAADRLEQSIKGEKKNSISRNVITQRIAQLRSLATFARPVTIASPARVPGSPASPKPVRDTVLAILLGLIVGVLLAFLRESLSRRITDAHEVQHQLQIPMLGYIEADVLGGVGINGNGDDRDSEGAIEPFRILRSNVEFLAPEQHIKTIAVTSPLAQEGKSTVAAGLAAATALAGKQVLLVECDLRRPVFAERFGLRGQPGLTDWAAGKAKPTEVSQTVSVEAAFGSRNGTAETADPSATTPSPLTVVVAGTFAPRPAELLGSDRFRSFLSQVGGVFDLVVLDCAPLLPVGDTLEVIPQVDAALICIRLDQTTQEQALAAKAAVEHFPPRPTGVVVTGVRPGKEGYYYGYYSSMARYRASVGAS